MSDAEVLETARDALRRHEWQRCYDAASAGPVAEAHAEAERLEHLADAAWWLGRLDECIEARRAAYQLFEELGQQADAGRSAVWLYEDHCLRGQPSIASGWLRRARRALDENTECAAYGALLLREAEAAHGAGELDVAMSAAEQARALGRDLRSADLEAESLQTIGRLLIDVGRPADGMAHLDEAMLLALEGRLSPYSTGKIYCSLISACEELGDLRRAAEWTDATAEWAQQYPFAIFPGICRVHRAVVLELGGALVDAEREALLACAELSGSHIPNAAAAHAEVGDIRRRLGDLEGAQAAFDVAEKLSGRTCVGGALLRLAQGRIDEAERIIHDCLPGQPPRRPARIPVLGAAVQVGIARGDLEGASAAHAELEEIAATYDSTLFHAQAALAAGRIRLAEHDIEGACTSLRNALQHWQDLEVPYEIATTRTLLGLALRESGDEDGAIASFADADAMFTRIGAKYTGRVEHRRDGTVLAG